MNPNKQMKKDQKPEDVRAETGRQQQQATGQRQSQGAAQQDRSQQQDRSRAERPERQGEGSERGYGRLENEEEDDEQARNIRADVRERGGSRAAERDEDRE